MEMNQALQVPEVLHNILGNFRPSFQLDATELSPRQLLKEHDDEEEAGDLHSLLNAALTCRLFLEPSLDNLWWASNDLTPLFSVLSGFQGSDLASDVRPCRACEIGCYILPRDCLARAYPWSNQ